MVKIPLEFDNEIYALNSSSLKPEKKEKKGQIVSRGEIIVKLLNPTFSLGQQGIPIFNDPWLAASQQVRDGPDERRGSSWTLGMQRRKLGDVRARSDDKTGRQTGGMMEDGTVFR